MASVSYLTDAEIYAFLMQPVRLAKIANELKFPNCRRQCVIKKISKRNQFQKEALGYW